MAWYLHKRMDNFNLLTCQMKIFYCTLLIFAPSRLMGAECCLIALNIHAPLLANVRVMGKARAGWTLG